MEKRYLIGVDVGTTGTKALLFSEDGALLGQAYQDYPILTPQVGHSEQNAGDWWNAVVTVIRSVCDGKDIGERVAAISLSTQGGTVVPVGQDGEPLRPALVWNDARCEAQKEAFLKEVGPERVMYEKTGWKLGCGLPALEIRWLRENEPALFEKTALFLTVPDYISLKMTGIPAVDPSNAGINQLIDIQTLRYDEKLLRFAGITEKQLPKLVRSGERIGHLTREAAETLGLSEKAVLISGAHDQYAVAMGAGAMKKGDILIGSGTCWVVTAMGDAPDFESGLSQSVSAAPELWGSMWSLSTGGVCLDWLRKNIAAGHNGEALDYATLNAEIPRRKAAEDGLFFFPFTGIHGEGAFTKATFTGLDLSHDRFHMARAVMEGVVFQIVWMLEAFAAKPEEAGIKLTGGAGRSAPWVQMLADISGLPVRIPEVADLACVGAAILAGWGSGIYGTPEEGYGKLSVKETAICPDPEGVKAYAGLAERYKQQAKALRKAYENQ